ncbi:MAG: hypothetical protein H7177_05780 [Rhizobacter sp.]|nr:hypothetical protein [Bacteriovorax sp.]
MKNLFLASILMTFALAAGASELIPATTLKLNSPDGLTNVQNLSVKLSTLCRYSSGIFWPESKNCGSNTIALKVDADGVVKIPSVEKFGGLHGRSTDYEVSLSIYDGEEYLAILSARGKDMISKFKFDNKTLSLYRVNAATLNISHDGADFFGSDLSQKDRAMLMISISDKVKKDYKDVLVVNSLESLAWAKENFASYSGKELLKDAKQIDLKKMNFAKFNGTANETIVVSAYYTVSNDYTNASKLSGSVEVALKASALEEIGTIELSKK